MSLDYNMPGNATVEDVKNMEMLDAPYEGPGDIDMCLGCGVTIAIPCAPYHNSEESMHGHGPICSGCARRELAEGDFISQLLGV